MTASHKIPDLGSRRTRIGICGAGDVVAKAHLPTLLAMPAVEVLWVSDIDHGRAMRVGKSFGVAGLPASSYMAQFPLTDIVLLAVPYAARKPYYDFLSSGAAAVYVEKPIAMTKEEHTALVERFPSGKLAVGLQRRALGSVATLKKLVEHGAFGKLQTIEFCHGSNAIVISGKSFGPNPQQTGGGVMFEHAIHGFDLALFVSGAEAAYGYKVRTVMHRQFDVHASGEVILRCKEQEVTLKFCVSWLEEVGEKLMFSFENATVDLSFSESLLDIRSRSGSPLLRLRGDTVLPPSTSFQVTHKYWETFLEGLRTSSANCTSAATSVFTTELIEQILIRGQR